MEASILDLRYRMKKVLQALDRNERVSVFYHGKIKGVIVPAREKTIRKVISHPLYGSLSKEKTSVKEVMAQLRDGRYRDL